MSNVYDADQLALQGVLNVDLPRVKKGDKVIVVVEGTIREFVDKAPAHSGDVIVAKIRTGEAIVLADDEAAQYREVLAEQRSAREVGTDQGNLAEGDDFDRMSFAALKQLAKDNDLNPVGKKAELAQLLRDNGVQP